MKNSSGATLLRVMTSPRSILQPSRLPQTPAVEAVSFVSANNGRKSGTIVDSKLGITPNESLETSTKDFMSLSVHVMNQICRRLYEWFGLENRYKVPRIAEGKYLGGKILKSIGIESFCHMNNHVLVLSNLCILMQKNAYAQAY